MQAGHQVVREIHTIYRGETNTPDTAIYEAMNWGLEVHL